MPFNMTESSVTWHTGSIWLVDHRLNYPTPGVNKPTNTTNQTMSQNKK